ncbi:Hypothetical protein PHPALM_11936 [Phytophthora palmivora]|uniref:Uncharacterized protein n=1 Tax=Phytophthora palmivora TaxID=4796 RepID=A0A2P4Y104_9STRA|nr:Hypothetical protein PHPALM_11936 [Phytophthora palmivora]
MSNRIDAQADPKPAEKELREYETHKVLQVFTFIVGREWCPQKRQFTDHWPMVEDDVISAGNFGRFMGHNRYEDILRSPHSAYNAAERTRDKL